jgi:hypothetical protein
MQFSVKLEATGSQLFRCEVFAADDRGKPYGPSLANGEGPTKQAAVHAAIAGTPDHRIKEYLTDWLS